MSQPKKTPNLLPIQTKGGPPQAIRRSVWNMLANAINSLQIIVPQTDGLGNQNPKVADIKLGDQGLIITMPPQYNTTGGAIGGAVGGSGLVQQLSIVSDGGDWYVCTDGSNTWYVIKDFKMRSGANAIGSETIDTSGVSQTNTYTYTGHTVSGVTAYYTRYATWTLSGVNYAQTSYPTPRPIAGNLIMAIGCTTTILSSNAPPANPSGGQLIDMTPRFWAK